MLFPIPLEAKKFGKDKFDPQVGFTYKDTKLISTVIETEIKQLRQNNIKIDEYTKLLSIYEFVTGAKYNDTRQSDEEEQDELIAHFSRTNLEEIIADLSKIAPTTPENVTIKQKTYKRDNKSVALLKLLHDFRCQICNSGIKIRNSKYYVEAAHIVSKSRKGPELPKNILILCPNHHKEFDLGERKILEHTDDFIKFDMNGTEYKLSLCPKTRKKRNIEITAH
jgi:putative restriction endonuclease